MRLIDADNFKERYCEENCGDRKCVDDFDRCNFISELNNQPTDYDVAWVDFKTEEDYKRFEEILKYYNNREEHDRKIRAKVIDDLIAKFESAKFADDDETVLSDIHQGVNSGLAMSIHFAKELRGGKNEGS